ncbi:hypothetical protein KJ840_01815 [Patescibacteria group bacterium]|nr:hypothetical protein [Patescibacteria group bacterium]
MFLTVHAASGIFIGSQVSAPWLAFILGFVSHWLLDFIPHGDEKVIDRSKFSESRLKKMLFYVAAADTLGIIILFYFLISTETIVLTSGILWGMLGAVAPDYLWGLHKITRIRVLKPLHKIHNWFHLKLTNPRYPRLNRGRGLPFKLGSLIQLAAFIAFFLLIIYL